MKGLWVEKLKSKFLSNVSKIVFLLIIYLILMDSDPRTPYLNLISQNWEARATVTFIAGILMLKPSVRTTQLTIIILLIIYSILIILFSQSGFDFFGLMIYALLVILLVKLVRRLK